jgi:hypothetical protein
MQSEITRQLQRSAPYGLVAIADDMTPNPMLLPSHDPVMRRTLLDTVVSTCMPAALMTILCGTSRGIMCVRAVIQGP